MSFSKKAAEIMHTLQTDYGQFKIPTTKKHQVPQKQSAKICKHNCSAVQVKIGAFNAKSPKAKYTRQSLMVQTPVIIQRKNQAKSMSVNKQLTQRKGNLKKVEPFVPIAVPKRQQQKFRVETPVTEATSRNKDIEIYVDNDGDDKECLKKLFKKIHSLTDQLAQSEKERVRMQLELEHLGRKDVSCKEHQKIINRLQGDIYKLQMENDILKKKARLYDETVPKQRDLVMEKPVQVRVEIPKYIPGPERVVQKIVEIPKYVQIQKKIPEVIVKEIKVPQIVQKQVFVDKPIYKEPMIIDKPVYVDKPIYVDRPVEVQKKVEVEVPVEIEVPVYIDRPMIDDEWLRKFNSLEDELGQMMKQNQILKGQNHQLKMTVNKQQANLELLNRHNSQKNKEVEMLLSNRGDYLPLRQDIKLQRTSSALDRTTTSMSPRSHRHLMYL